MLIPEVKRVLVFVVNPAAGGSAAKECMKKLEPVLREAGIAWQTLYTERAGHATELAAAAASREDCEAVISVGGDGTAYEVAAGLLGSGKPMGIIPSGTGNDFIKSLNYPKDPVAALRLILKRELKPVDLVSLNERCFLNVTGTGFDVTVLQQAEKYRGRLKGLLPYLLGLLKALRVFRPVRIGLELDGVYSEREALICAVANGRYIGGGIPICPAARPDDGLLDVVLVNSVPRWRTPFYVPGLLMGRVLRWRVTEHVRCRSVRITGRDMFVQIDGEITRMEEAAMRVLPGQLMLYR